MKFNNEKTSEFIQKLQGKKVLIYGVGLGFELINNQINIVKNLNIAAFSDKKFEKENPGKLYGIKTIKPDDIVNIDFDYILVTNERSDVIEQYLVSNLHIDRNKIIKIFPDIIPITIKDEIASYTYLKKFNFEKHLKYLNKKLKHKKVILYGAGVFLEAVNKYYDLSGLNIIGISDIRFDEHKDDETFLGYKVYSIDEVKQLKPDYILVTTKFYIDIIENLYCSTFKNYKIKIKPLLRKPFLTLLNEIWS